MSKLLLKIFGYPILIGSLLGGNSCTTQSWNIPTGYVVKEEKDLLQKFQPEATATDYKPIQEPNTEQKPKQETGTIDPKYLVPVEKPPKSGIQKILEEKPKTKDKYNGLFGGGITTGSKTLDFIILAAFLGLAGKGLHDHFKDHKHHHNYGGGEGPGGPGGY